MDAEESAHSRVPGAHYLSAEYVIDELGAQGAHRLRTLTTPPSSPAWAEPSSAKYIPVFLAVTALVAANFQHTPANLWFFSVVEAAGRGPGLGRCARLERGARRDREHDRRGAARRAAVLLRDPRSVGLTPRRHVDRVGAARRARICHANATKGGRHGTRRGSACRSAHAVVAGATCSMMASSLRRGSAPATRPSSLPSVPNTTSVGMLWIWSRPAVSGLASTLHLPKRTRPP